MNDDERLAAHVTRDLVAELHGQDAEIAALRDQLAAIHRLVDRAEQGGLAIVATQAIRDIIGSKP